MFHVTSQQTHFIKGFAIILIFVYHCFGFLQLQNYLCGQIGVELFLIASGYGLAQSIDKYPNAFSFMKKRVTQLFPKYLVTLLAICAVFGHFSSTDFLMHITFLNGLFSPYFFGIDNAFWFMSMIFLCYLLVAIVWQLSLERFFLLFGIGLYILLTQVYSHNDTILTHLVLRIPTFVFAYWFSRFWCTPNRQFLNRNNTADAIAVVAFYVTAYFFTFGLFYHLGITLSLLSVLFALSRITPINKACTLVGVYSYEIYLVHDPALKYIAQVMARDNALHGATRIIVLFVSGITLTIALTCILVYGFKLFSNLKLAAAKRLFNGVGVR
ncbi:MAG: acyltransferase [Pseudomonadota bacterium]